MRVSRTVLGGALGATPEVYSLHDSGFLTDAGRHLCRDNGYPTQTLAASNGVRNPRGKYSEINCVQKRLSPFQSGSHIVTFWTPTVRYGRNFPQVVWLRI
jgi:hypothetical protein